MGALSLDVTYPEQRNRLTAAFRMIVVIPHMIVAQAWGYFVQLIAVVQWFIIVFTGKRNRGIYDMQRAWLDYYGRVITYASLLHDVFPPFISDEGNVPVRTGLEYEEAGSRLTTALRFLWVIPAALITFVVVLGAYVVGFVSWLAIIFTGQQSKGMWDFIHRAVRLVLRLQVYTLLMTDTYPSYS